MIEMLFYVGVVVVIECVMMDLINDGVIVGGIVVVSLVVIFVLVFIIIFFCWRYVYVDLIYLIIILKFCNFWINIENWLSYLIGVMCNNYFFYI